jgi:tRNA(Ile)-lysidine synthase
MRDQQGLSPADFDSLFEPLRSFDHLLLAVSGGVDSTVLLNALCQWLNRCLVHKIQAPSKISVACVDHNLREGSAREARAVKQMAQRLGCDGTILRWQGEKPLTGLQEKAREMRYALLQKQALKIKADAIVLAHHADDQAETLLMRMAAGSGPEGLCGMQIRSEREGLVLLRPFLKLPKAALVATAQAAQWPWHEDPSNQHLRFERVRLRQMQSLREAAGLTSARLVRLSERLARQQEAVDWMVAHYWRQLVRQDTGTLTFEAGLWALPAEIVLRLLAKALHVLNPDAVLRLERLELLQTSLYDDVLRQQNGRRTLGGCVLSLSRKGDLTLMLEPKRRRGRPVQG